jgi:hypothetical protein
MECTLFILGVKPTKIKNLQLPNMEKIPRKIVEKAAGSALRSDLPLGKFTLMTHMLDDSSTKRGIVLFEYNKRSRCSDVGEMHKRLPPVPIPVIPSPQIMGNPPIGADNPPIGAAIGADNPPIGAAIGAGNPPIGAAIGAGNPPIGADNPPIGAGSAFLGEEHSHDNMIIEPVKDSLEAERRNRMVKAVAKYIYDHKLPLEITETVLVNGSQCSPFRGGGDCFLFGEKNNAVILILDDEEMATETKMQASKWAETVAQLKANMLVCTATSFYKLCEDFPRKAVTINRLITYGLIVGLGKPIYLIKSTMQFNPPIFDYCLIMQKNWCTKATAYIDHAFHHCITELTKS